MLSVDGADPATVNMSYVSQVIRDEVSFTVAWDHSLPGSPVSQFLRNDDPSRKVFVSPSHVSSLSLTTEFTDSGHINRSSARTGGR